MGLGDAIICAPIIAKHAAENPNETIWVPAWVHNHESVKSFFVNYPNVSLILFHNEQDYIREFVSQADIKLGFYNPELPQLRGENFIMWFYRQAQMTQADRWKWCPIQDAAELIVQIPSFFNGNHIFMHHDAKRRFIIDYAYGGIINSFKKNVGIFHVEDYAAPSILGYVKMINQANEIHCIDSSFIHLAEALETTGKLFYHQYARPNSTDNYQFRKPWKTIKE